MSKPLEKTSKFLSLVLRHEPERIGLQMDSQGWASIDELLAKASTHLPLTDELLHQVVSTSDKKRFAISEDGRRIRANQGHSVQVELGLQSQTPPGALYHGTATRFLDSIRQQGLLRGERHHVHLSANMDTAVAVGKRHGTVVVLTVKAAQMQQAGHVFFCSENGVWLTKHVPVEFLVF